MEAEMHQYQKEYEMSRTMNWQSLMVYIVLAILCIALLIGILLILSETHLLRGIMMIQQPPLYLI
jgi:hypothetical protein